MRGALAGLRRRVIHSRPSLIYVIEKSCNVIQIRRHWSSGGQMHESDQAYFMRRAAEERAAAERHQHPTARQSHVELAERYEAAAAAVTRPKGAQAAFRLVRPTRPTAQ
jgi:hypothetical protein